MKTVQAVFPVWEGEPHRRRHDGNGLLWRQTFISACKRNRAVSLAAITIRFCPPLKPRSASL